ncbi:MAG: hypothetical protein O2816_17455, partial [Planctomycetota bacterium]|nr:hypothetical protein [Planctomycetota bacterium]
KHGPALPPGPPGVVPPAPIPLRSPANPGGIDMGPDLTLWNFWWGFNRDRYIRPSFPARVPSTDDRQLVRAALLKAIDRRVVEPQLHAACLIGLAKLGDSPSSANDTPLRPWLRSHVPHPSPVVAEAATMALGILGDDRAVPFLGALVFDEESARQELGLAEVPFRIRTFAAYSLGLIAHAASDDAPRRVIAELLVDVLDAPQFLTRDLKIACMQAFGLCPLESRLDVEDPAALGPSLRHVLSREAQVRYLIDYCDPESERARSRTRHYTVGAHAPAAMARLIRAGRGVDEDCRAAAAERLHAIIHPQSKSKREVQWGAIQALGTIGTASGAGGKQGTDTRIRETLEDLVRDGDPMSRRFALISLGLSSGRPGEGPEGSAGAARARKRLEKEMLEGRSQLRPWAGLAIGIHNRQLLDHGLAIDEDSLSALLGTAQSCRNPFDLGAYLTGLGLSGYAGTKEVALAKLEYWHGADEPQGTCAVTLGLFGDREALPAMRGQLLPVQSEELLMYSASALGMLGDLESLLAVFEVSARRQTAGEVALALGNTRDRRAVGPLIALLTGDMTTASTRAFSAAALGNLCARNVLPWSAPYAVGLNYRACTTTMTDGYSHGLLDIL